MRMTIRRLRRGVRAAAVVAGVAALVGVFGLASPAAADSPQPFQDQFVVIDLFAFTPQNVEVTAGQTVEWTNLQAGVPHTVTFDSSGIGSPVLSEGETWETMFAVAPEEPLAYHCEIHPSMTGTVTVTAP